MQQENPLAQQQLPYSRAIESQRLAAASGEQANSSWEFYRGAVIGGARGHVLEIGVGKWMNLTRYSHEVKSLSGIEPDAASLRQARQRAEQLGLNVDLRQAQVEALPFADASFDTVTGTLVWCSVVDVPAGLREVMRVLKPGGELRFLEHVRSRSHRAARVQDMITPLWRLFTGGCHPNRDTEQAIRAAGFEIVECWRVNIDRSFATPTLIGVAIKR